ncbi:MAG: hypothetical protein WC508_04120 [Patescibacteria group bacterium]
MKKKILKIIRILLIIVVLLFLLWLVDKNFPVTKPLSFEVNFNQDQAAISKLKPVSRLLKLGDNQVILGSPVYFNFRPIQFYRLARFEIVYQQNGRSLTEMGGKSGVGWSYNLEKPILISDVGNGWQKAIFDFDLTKLYRPRNFMEFIINSSGESNQTMAINQIKVTLYR